MKTRDILAVFNRGRVSRLSQARTDVARVALSADIQTNWMPRTLGPMMLRPGLEFIGETGTNGALIPFVFSNADTAIIELSGPMQVWEDGETLVERPAVATVVVNGQFTTDLTGWTDADESGAASTWHSSGWLQLIGTGFNSAKRQRLVTVDPADYDTQHGLRIDIQRGPVVLRIGTTAGADDIFRQAVLRTGIHSIAFTPGADFYIEFSSARKYATLVDHCVIEQAGTMTLTTTWNTLALARKVRWQRVGDVVFCACDGKRPRRIERRPNSSWSIVDYLPEDGPFLTENVENIRITPSAISGTITLTASREVFQTGHIGALWRLTSQGQLVQSSLTAEDTWSNPIRVTGVGDDRKFTVTRSGTWSATVSLQRSIGEIGSWVTVATYTTNAAIDYDDELDNVEAFYRIGIETGNYTSGTAVLALEFSAGSITGVVRIVTHASGTSVGAIVLTELGGTDPTEIWAEGEWSDEQVWPQAVALSGGRLWWVGEGKAWASVPDAFENFDPETVGDAAPINRSIGDGATAMVNWLLPMQHLIAGSDSAEHSLRSTSFDEPVTPSNYQAKMPTTKGSISAPAAIADNRGYFIGKSGASVFELEYDGGSFSYGALKTTLLVPEIGSSPFTRIAVQQEPDVRVYAIREDGTAGVMVRDPLEDVLCWVDIETDGAFLDVVVLPGQPEDRVYFRVRRAIQGVSRRYLERLALESEGRGGTTNKLADSFVTGSTPTTTLTGLDHLEDETVVLWADGVDLGEHVVAGGEIALADEVTDWCAGLPYEATFRSARLAGQTQLGLALTQRSRVNKIGLILADTHAQGLRFGPDFDTLDDMPGVEAGEDVDPDTVHVDYDRDMIEFPGEWSTDNRLCMVAAAPRPCTVLAAVLNVDRTDRE